MRQIRKKHLHYVGIIGIPILLFVWVFYLYAEESEDIRIRRIMGQRISYNTSSELEIRLQAYVSASDYRNETTRQYALNLASKNSGSYNLRQVLTIFDEISNKWQYVNDPRTNELISKASFSVQNGFKGDCDDYAVLLSSLIQSIGGKTRIVNGFNHTSSHAFAELFIGNQAKKQETSYLLHKRYGRNYPNGLVIHYSKDANGNYWLNLDWSAKYPGGPYFQSNSQIIYFTEEGKYEVRKK
jgi:transglutaminase-like putative cysteine protease